MGITVFLSRYCPYVDSKEDRMVCSRLSEFPSTDYRGCINLPENQQGKCPPYIQVNNQNPPPRNVPQSPGGSWVVQQDEVFRGARVSCKPGTTHDGRAHVHETQLDRRSPTMAFMLMARVHLIQTSMVTVISLKYVPRSSRTITRRFTLVFELRSWPTNGCCLYWPTGV